MSKRFLITKPKLMENLEANEMPTLNLFIQEGKLYEFYTLKGHENSKEVMEYIKMHNPITLDNEFTPKKKGIVQVTRKVTPELNFLNIFENNIIILEILHEEKALEKLTKNSVDITENPLFSTVNLAFGNVEKIIIEGCDFAGKTTLANRLVQLGMAPQERDLENFSFWIRDYYDPELINETIKEKINKNLKYVVITLDEEVLKERMNSREVLSEFDKIAPVSNRIYSEIDLKGMENVFKIHINSKEDNAFQLLLKAMEEKAKKDVEISIAAMCEAARIVGSRTNYVEFLEDYETNADLYKKIVEMSSIDGFLDECIEEVLNENEFKFSEGEWVTNASGRLKK